jgi:hypothetical protein
MSSVADRKQQQSSKPYKVKARPTPGYIYLYSEEGAFLLVGRILKPSNFH